MIGVSKMYFDIPNFLGISDFKIVEPYNNYCNSDILIISNGYFDKVRLFNPDSEIMEVKSATFLELIETLENFKRLEIGDLKTIDESINYLKKKDLDLKTKNRDFILNFGYNVTSNSKFIEKIINDLGFNRYPFEKNILIVPDYDLNLKNASNFDLKIVLKTHKYGLSTVERIEDRYLSILNSLNNIHPNKT
ncbi:conserved hypothetical protein [Methanococcus vannielii SB]|uniref:Segregation and condensation protein B n=1 Tax=Methanococcus vannielii (strain ATCC 35089 / DSM 1224 / JCM 13029 / OCM 148 / SB) TaxID=406327 RepID=A6US87_METVS|nr:hypothetical protein [Methanococcus vannielii]ABR55359.1 conserved hypothetical protein [Methanococcus vannielii SB]